MGDAGKGSTLIVLFPGENFSLRSSFLVGLLCCGGGVLSAILLSLSGSFDVTLIRSTDFFFGVAFRSASLLVRRLFLYAPL